jgi:hypothetical protein
VRFAKGRTPWRRSNADVDVGEVGEADPAPEAFGRER